MSSRDARTGHPSHSNKSTTTVKAKNTKNTILRLLTYFQSKKLQLLVVLLSMTVATILGLFTPYAIGLGVDYITEGNVNRLLLLVIVLIGIYLIQELLQWFQTYQIGKLSQSVIYDIRNDSFTKLHKLSISFFHKKPFGELMSRFTNDVENINNTLSQFFTQFIVSFVTITGATIIMLKLNVILAVTSFITIPLVLILTKIISKKSKELFRGQSKQLGILNGYMEEAISNVEIIKSFQQEEHIINDMQVKNEQYYEISRKAQIWSGYLMPLLNIINNIGYTAIVFVGGLLVIKGEISIGLIASFVTYSRLFTRPINELSSMYNMLQSSIAGAERIFEIMDTEEENDPISPSTDSFRLKGYVAFNNVTFSYDGTKNDLTNVSFTIQPGKRVALVGPTGAGKTTITALLTRMYEVNKGEIMLDDKNISQYSLLDIRNQISSVLQDAYLFHGTIAENIKYGKITATNEEIVKAAKLANAHDFIIKLPNGYDTLLVENGSNISQGERQLISIARSILQNPSILILDEATNNVDTLTEKKIQAALWKFMDSRTTFIIAHRLDTILQADVILVIEEGNIIEMGSHKELLTQKGSYFKLFENYTKNQFVNDMTTA